MPATASSGASPAERLSAQPGVQRVPSRLLDLFIVKNFLDAATCAALIEQIDERGEAVAAIEQGFVQGEIEEAAFRWNTDVESGERVIVGVNLFAEDDAEVVELLRLDPEGERRQIERTARVRAERDAAVAESTLAEVGRAAAGTENLLPPMREALRAQCTIGEICNVLRAEFGTFDASRA